MVTRHAIVPPSVLVVEDSPDDATVVRMTFEEVGFTNPLYFVEDGQEAIDYLNGAGMYADRDLFPIPMLVILDINLPKRDGFEVLWATERARAEGNVRTVVLSVSDSPDDAKHAQSLGALKMLHKPIDPGLLIQTISELSDLGLLIVPR